VQWFNYFSPSKVVAHF